MDIQLAAETEFEGAEKTGGLELLPAGDDARERLVGAKAKSVLAENWALVEVGGDKVRGHPNDLHALVVGLTISRSPREGGK